MKSGNIRLLTVAILLSLPAFQAQPAAERPYDPTLGDLMGMTQLRHFKLSYAGRSENWELAR